MLSPLKRHRERLVILFLLGYPLVGFLTRGHRGRPPNFVDRTVLAVTAPLQGGLTFLVDGVATASGDYVALRGVRAHNLELEAENARLRREVHELEEAGTENERLKRMLGYAQTTGVTEIPARVVGVNPTPANLSLRIDRGQADGVEVGMPVVTPDGVVGQVIRASGSYADVQLLADASTRLAVRTQRSRARATAAGSGRLELDIRLEHALRTEEFREGDWVVTAGTDGIFPPGLRVGRISRVERRSHGMFQAAEVELSVDTVRLEEVLVVPVRPVSTVQAQAGGEP